jgi:hypothetical protein
MLVPVCVALTTYALQRRDERRRVVDTVTESIDESDSVANISISDTKATVFSTER